MRKDKQTNMTNISIDLNILKFIKARKIFLITRYDDKKLACKQSNRFCTVYKEADNQKPCNQQGDPEAKKKW